MKYNIIGDIHGRTNWKRLARPDCVNIFVGDYFSPYDRNITFEKQRSNFMDIVTYKIQHPETILLIGNHDEDHWHIHERYSRFDAIHFNEIKELFEENKDLFQVAYSIDNKVLATHAGVSVVWYARYKYKKNLTTIINLVDEPDEYESIYGRSVKNDSVIKYSEASNIEDAANMYYTHSIYCSNWADENRKPRDGHLYFWKNHFYLYNVDTFILIDPTPTEVASFVNELWLNGKYAAFNFRNNSSIYDTYGDSEMQGPLWIRPYALSISDIFAYSEFAQVVGHTQFEHPSCSAYNAIRTINGSIDINGMDLELRTIFVDCLGYNNESIIYNAGKFEINTVK